jgi:hypothetical protein
MKLPISKSYPHPQFVLKEQFKYTYLDVQKISFHFSFICHFVFYPQKSVLYHYGIVYSVISTNQKSKNSRSKLIHFLVHVNTKSISRAIKIFFSLLLL